MMKRATTVVMVLALLVFGMSSVGQTQAYKLSLGHGAMEGHQTHLGSLRLAKLVKERSNGRLEIQVFPNRQLGEERVMVEGLQLGTVDITVVSTGPLGGFVPMINVVDLPFLFNDAVHAYSVLDGPIGQELLDKFSAIGIVGAAFWENGWRHLTTKRPVRTPADLKGMKIRTMENKIHIATFKALGASPIPMVWGEVYTSLQQGVIDGQENPITIIYTNALWEVQKYVQLTGHFYGPHLVLISKITLERLPKDLQSLLISAAREVAPYQRAMSAKLEKEQLELLRQKGMEILEVDREAFRKATAGVYSEFEGLFGRTLIDRILAAGGR